MSTPERKYMNFFQCKNCFSREERNKSGKVLEFSKILYLDGLNRCTQVPLVTPAHRESLFKSGRFHICQADGSQNGSHVYNYKISK